MVPPSEHKQAISNRIEEYEEEIEEKIRTRDARGLADYIDKKQLDTFFEDDEGDNVIDAMLLALKLGGKIDPTKILSIGELILKIFKEIKKRTKEYSVIPRWHAGGGFGNYTYHITKENEVWDKFTRYLKSQYPFRYIKEGKEGCEIGLLFGKVGKNHRIEIEAVATLQNIIDMTNIKDDLNQEDWPIASNLRFACQNLKRELGGNKNPAEIGESLERILKYFLLDENDTMIISKARWQKCLFKRSMNSKIRFSTKKLIRQFGKSSNKKEFLKRRFLGFYIFEEGILEHSIITGDVLKEVFKDSDLGPKDFGVDKVKEFPRLLFLDNYHYNLVNGVFRSFINSYDTLPRMGNILPPPIVLCFDYRRQLNRTRKNKITCMCIGQNPEYGYQRIRHLMHKPKVRVPQRENRLKYKYPHIIRV